MSGQPKPAFYGAVFFVAIALVAFAGYQARHLIFPKPNVPQNPVQIDPHQLGGGDAAHAEAPDDATVTTVKEYTFKPSERLPPVKGTAAYKPLQANTVKFALYVWAGWAPIIIANDGFKANKVWKTQDGKEFKVELVLIDNPVEMRDNYAAGDVHIGWATLDMLPLFVDSFVDASGNPRDSRIMPRVYQQVDWSNGGDGIVSRDTIKTVADLRGKKIALAENSPSHYFLLNMLVGAGVQPGEVNLIFTPTAFEAAAAFNKKSEGIDAAVSWAPAL